MWYVYATIGCPVIIIAQGNRLLFMRVSPRQVIPVAIDYQFVLCSWNDIS